MIQDIAGNRTDGIFGGTSIRHDFTGLPPIDAETEHDETILPTHYKFGIAYNIIKEPQRNWLVALDMDDRLHLGTEYLPFPTVAIRGGLQIDLSDAGESPTYALGGTLDYKALAFNYAYELPPTLPATSLFSISGSFDFQRSPMKIRNVKIRDEGVFLVHHVFYARKEDANVIVIQELASEEPQTRTFRLDDYATVLSLEPDKRSEFRRNVDRAWEAIEAGKELQKGGTVRMPAASKLRLRMEKTGYIHEYTTSQMTYEMESEDKIGRVWLENRSNKPVDVTVKLIFDEYMDEFRAVTDTYEIPPRSVASIALQHLTFLNSPKILQRRTTGPVDAQIAIAATTGEKLHKDVIQAVPDFQLHGINTIVWQEEEDLFKLGSFIAPRDKPVKYFADAIMAMYEGEHVKVENETIRKVLLLSAALKTYGITYVNDADVSSYGQGTDTIYHAREMLEPVVFVDKDGNKRGKGVGDCDDSTVLFATLMQALDVHPLLILQAGHVLVAFDTGIPHEVAKQIAVGTLGKEWFHLATGTAWIPIETTLLKENYDFGDAWKKGLERIESGIIEAIPVSLAQWKYKPADIYNEDAWTPALPTRDQIDRTLDKEQSLTWLETLSTQAVEIRKTQGTVTAGDE